MLAGDHIFKAVYDKWLAHRSLSLENEGRQSTPKQIERVFKKDVFPLLRHMTIYDVTRAHLLDIIGRVEERGSFSVAEKLRTWFTQLFTYASVVVPDNLSSSSSSPIRLDICGALSKSRSNSKATAHQFESHPRDTGN